MRPFSWTEPTLLAESGIQLWWLPPQAEGDPPGEQDQALLNQGELKRADRFHFLKHRFEFIRRRAFLRRVLGELGGVDPTALAFEEGPFGKPSLVGGGLAFNQSRSGGASLLATSPCSELGVDLELLKDPRKLESVAARVQSPEEKVQWQGIPEDERMLAFFRLWTRKEALMKVTGEGFQREAASFTVGLEERLGQAPRPVDFEGWGPMLLVDLPMPAPFRGALAVCS